MGICGIYRKDIIKSNEPARSRTWNLLIRSQTRYPLRHWPPHVGGREADLLSSETRRRHISTFWSLLLGLKAEFS